MTVPREIALIFKFFSLGEREIRVSVQLLNPFKALWKDLNEVHPTGYLRRLT